MDTLYITAQDESIQYLKRRDKRLARVIETIGDIECPVPTDPFRFVVYEIVGQMISSTVKKVFIDRLEALCKRRITAAAIRKLDTDTLRGIGLSKSKAESILALADHVRTHRKFFAELEHMDDDDVMRTLTRLKGIGAWTAMMYLLFYLRRPDVLPYNDQAFLQSYKWLYATDDTSRESVCTRCRKWSPYSSTAARYLYKALDSGLTKTSRKG